jgi:hypothetical protein
VARRWTSDIEVLKDGRLVRTVVTDAPVAVYDANDRGDVAVQVERAGRISAVLYPADGGPARALGPGPCDGSPGFTNDGASVVVVRGDRQLGRDTVLHCTLAGECRRLVTVPSADVPALSPAGDRVAYVAWSPYRHVALANVATGETRIVASSLFCRPRWAGDRLWIARGVPDKFNWIELDAASATPTGRSVPGAHGCDAAEPGPGGVMAKRAQIVHHETSRVLAVTGGI